MTAAKEDPPRRYLPLLLVVSVGSDCSGLTYDEILAHRQLPEELFGVSDERRNLLWEALGGMPAGSW